MTAPDPAVRWINAAQGPVRLGVTRVEVEDHHGGWRDGYSHVQTKEAHFNLEGFRAAHKACAALMAEMPEVDWKAVERAENQEIAEAERIAAQARSPDHRPPGDV